MTKLPDITVNVEHTLLKVGEAFAADCKANANDFTVKAYWETDKPHVCAHHNYLHLTPYMYYLCKIIILNVFPTCSMNSQLQQYNFIFPPWTSTKTFTIF